MLSDLTLFSLVLIMSCNQFKIFFNKERQKRKEGREGEEGKRERGTKMFIRKNPNRGQTL